MLLALALKCHAATLHESARQFLPMQVYLLPGSFWALNYAVGKVADLCCCGEPAVTALCYISRTECCTGVTRWHARPRAQQAPTTYPIYRMHQPQMAEDTGGWCCVAFCI